MRKRGLFYIKKHFTFPYLYIKYSQCVLRRVFKEMNKKYAIFVVDMLNDFVTGVIGCDNAKAIVKPTQELLEGAVSRNAAVAKMRYRLMLGTCISKDDQKSDKE